MNSEQEPNRNDQPFGELTNEQNSGIYIYGLSVQDVHAPNFGAGTLISMAFLRSQHRVSNNQEAFELLRGLNNIQSIGICIYLLNREDVESPNFEEHSLTAMDVLIYQFKAASRQEAFEMVRGLDAEQTMAMTIYGLARDQVLTPNFGSHTLVAMNTLVSQLRLASSELAFQLVSGLKEYQTHGITDYGLNRTQVMNPAFTESIFNVMEALHARSPILAKKDLYDTAIHLLEEYQIRGIQLQLTLDQIGIAEIDGIFNQGLPEDHRFRPNHIDVIAHLMKTENMHSEEAYKEALKLNSAQIIGITDFGLRLEQVWHSSFLHHPEVLGKLLELSPIKNRIQEENLSIPLDQEQKEKIRNIFDSMIIWANVDQSTENIQTDIQHTDHEMLRTLTETTGVASMPIYGNQQNNEGEDISTMNLEGEIAQNFPSEGRGFFRSAGSDASFEDSKPAAEDRKKIENQFVGEEVTGQVEENLPEQHQDILGGLERGGQGVQELTAEPNDIHERGTEVGESFRNLPQSPRESPVLSDKVRPRDPNSINAKTRKKRKGNPKIG